MIIWEPHLMVGINILNTKLFVCMRKPFKFFCSKKDISMRNKCERSNLRQNISVNRQNISVICLQLLLVSKKDSEVIFHSRAAAREARQRSTMGKKNCGNPPLHTAGAREI